MKLTTYFLFLLILIAGCSVPEEPSKSGFDETNTFGLNTTMLLQGDSNVVVLGDYFKDVSMIDSIEVPAGLNASFTKGDETIILYGNAKNWLSILNCYVGTDAYAVVLRKPAIERVRLEFDPQGENYESVELVGDINGWTSGKHSYQLVGNVWVLDTLWYPGGYAYRLELDGEQMLDPGNAESVPNGFGAFNSFLKVERSNTDKIPELTFAAANAGNVNVTTTVSGDWVALWQNQVIASGNGNIVIPIPDVAGDMNRSYIRVWSSTEEGLSNEVKIPLAGMEPVSSSAALTRLDKEKNIMYFMLVDRFVNGDTSIDEPVEDERILPRANYYGGDLEGVRQKLNDGYFDQLGINTLWVSPITQNPRGAYQEYPEPRRWFSGYHGYWPVSFKKVDHRFGTNAGLATLVDETHAADKNIILDYVCNHVHQEHPVIIANPEWKTDLVLPDGRRNLRLWDEQRLTTWFDDFLPTLDYSIPEVTDVMSDSALWWIEEFDFDGFRHDATKHIPERFWRVATRKLKALGDERGRSYFQVGETFGSRELIQSYIGAGMMEGQFDFNLYFDAVTVFKDTTSPMTKLSESLMASLNFHGSLHQMCNITGNHDLTRFISLAGKAVRDDEDQKEAGWQREIKVEDPVGYAKLKMLETFIMTIPGIPVIFYGDDIGMAGANDPDNRRMMRFDNLSDYELDVREHVSKITRIRADHMALLFGDVKILRADEDVMVFSRTYMDDQVVTLFNNSDESIEIELPLSGSFTAALENGEIVQNASGLTVRMEPFSSQIIYTP